MIHRSPLTGLSEIGNYKLNWKFFFFCIIRADEAVKAFVFARESNNTALA